MQLREQPQQRRGVPGETVPDDRLDVPERHDVLAVDAPFHSWQQADREVGRWGEGGIGDVVIGHVRRRESLGGVPGGEVRRGPAAASVVGGRRVRVVVDHRRGGVRRYDPGHGPGEDHGGTGEEHHRRHAQARAHQTPARGAGPQCAPRCEQQRPRPDQRPGTAQAHEREGVERVREGGEENIEEGTNEVGVARRLAGHRVHERGQRPQGREEHERGERERDRVASDQLQP